MLSAGNDPVLTTDEVLSFLKISRPTLLKYIHCGKIRAVKLGKGWKILESELIRFLGGRLN
jgi:excisionase family DNA binding protein